MICISMYCYIVVSILWTGCFLARPSCATSTWSGILIGNLWIDNDYYYRLSIAID